MTGPGPAPDADADGARHSSDWYVRAPGAGSVPEGTLLALPCDDAPRRYRFERFPPRLEVEEHGGVYVLVDDGPVRFWRYRFVSR